MSQHGHHQQPNKAETLHGFGSRERAAAAPPAAAARETGFVPVGARVGRSGQLFETEAGDGAGRRVVKLFTWAAGLPERVVHDFTRDAMTVANLRHPHVVQVADVGTLGDGTPFVVMERLRGTTLQEAMDAAPLRAAELLPILRGVAAALAAAHAAGVAHGEVRPDNIFLAEMAGYGRGFAKLLDFGVARLAGAARGLGLVVGEAPFDPAAEDAQVAAGGPADERTDQRALAILAARALGESAPPVAQRVLARAANPVRDQRFGSVASFFDALEGALASAGAASPPAGAAVTATLPIGATVATFPIGAVVVRSPAAAPAPRPPVVIAAAPPVPAAVAPPPGIAASSLTQQFFAEGDRQDLAHAAGTQSGQPAVAAADDDADDADDDDAQAVSPKGVRVPRSRAQMAAAACLALASVAVIAWTVVSLSGAHGSSPVPAPFAPAPFAAGPSTPAAFRVAPATPPSSSSSPMLPAQGRLRGADRRTRGARTAARADARFQPPPLALAAVAAPAPVATSAAAPPPTPAALPPVGVPQPAVAAPPVPAAPAPAAAAPPPAPAAGASAAPSDAPAAAAPAERAAPADEDVTQPSEQTDPNEPAPPAPATP
jgi:serine/threonine-protein kinase